MPTKDEQLLYLNREIAKLKDRLAGYNDRTLRGERHGPSYSRTIEQRQRLIAERDRLLRMQESAATPQVRPETHKQTSEEFTHSPDYRSLTHRGKNYSLTAQQAHVIQILHDAYRSGNRELSGDYIMEEIGTRNSELRDTFRKSNPAAWKALIQRGAKRGTYRLNL